MPQFDESFLSDCAHAERWNFYSYNVQQQQQQQQVAAAETDRQPQLWSALDNNNNNNSGSSNNSGSNNNSNSGSHKNTLHDIKFHRRRKYKKLPRLALSTLTTTTATPTDSTCNPSPPLTSTSTASTSASSASTSPYALVKNALRYGSISTPSTPGNCSTGGGVGGCNSNSNSNNSINSSSGVGGGGNYTSTASTPPPLPQTPQSQRVPPAPPSASNTSSSSGGSSGGSSGHKNSLKGTKLARRARSFKDDLIEKISLMRTNNNTLGRSHSPHSPRNKHASNKPPPTTEEVQRSTQTLETHVKDISNALKHFRDVILKKKLEVLPGNGTVILETIASMYSVIQSYTLNENSAIMSCATQQVYQSLGKLIKLCDEVMLTEKSGECASLSNENVREVIDLLEEAVRNLVTLAQGKLKEQDQCAFRYGATGNIVGGAGGLGGIGAAADIMGAVTAASAAGMGSAVAAAAAAAAAASATDAAAVAAAVAQRTSLPDIALTPKERDILEQSNVNPMRGSHSTESILRDTSPPPKPPLPNRSSNPPPLPPKRRSQPSQSQSTNASSQANSPLPYAQSHNISINSDLDCSSNFSLLNYGGDRLSVRSRSPDENSQCSFDSALNHSREDEEQQLQQKLPMRVLHQLQHQQHQQLEDDMDKLISYKAQAAADAVEVANASGASTGTAAAASGSSAASGSAAAASGLVDSANTELRKAAAALTSNRHSNESGFVSMMSFRTSTQSVSKHSSEHSVQSSTKSSSNNSEIAFGATSSSSSSTEYQQISQMQSTTQSTQSTQRNHITSSSTTTSNTNGNTSSSSTTTKATATFASSSSEQLSSTSTATTLQTLGSNCSSPELAPALPPKTIQRLALTRLDTAMDELDDSNFELPELRHLSPHHHQHHSSSQQLHQWQSKHHSLIEPPRSAQLPSSSCSGASAFDRHLDKLDKPPPLPIKKKHILAYMEICSATSHSVEQHRHTMCAYNVSRSNISHSQTMSIMPVSKDMSPPEQEQPPALPPKNYKQRKPSATPPAIITTPPASPKPQLGDGPGGSGVRNSRMTTVSEELNDLQAGAEEEGAALPDSNENVNAGGSTFYCHSHQLPNESACAVPDALTTPITTPTIDMEPQKQQQQEVVALQDVELAEHDDEHDHHEHDDEGCVGEQCVELDLSLAGEEEPEVDNQLPNMLEEIDITPYLILKKRDEDGPEVKGGYIDALIVHASRVQKVADNAFSEAFITTFRTFIQPIDVIEKLTHRYTYFFCQVHDQKQKAAKETFSLLVRVVNDLTSTDLTNQLLSLLVEFVYQLVCSGQLYLAKLLRIKFVEKVKLYKDQKTYCAYGNDHRDHSMPLGATGSIGSSLGSGNQLSLLDLKSLEIAEQMTLLDAELFQKIEIPEVLLFAKDQCEEKSPNLNKFTEHFNKMSYWARSKILRLHDAKEREKHVNKFIKIMKHLRKMNNYNSYLALLSALDSGPIRRLEWQKGIAEEVRSFCALIDSSSSFRAYRQALAETNPPCIPYIGLVLQDLTFVHVGNQDYMSKGVINFSKRWQQYNIIVNMKRFKKCAYPFKRNERIIGFFDNFKDFMGEEEMWQISERIKPRGRRQVNY